MKERHITMKVCTRCKIEKPISDFGLQKTRSTRLYRKPHCRACDVDRSRQYRLTEAGKASRVKEHRKRFAGVLNLYRLIKAQQNCLLCQESDPVCIDFHHLERARKERALVDTIRSSFTKFLREAAKCICLCANCHRKLHAGRVSLPPGTKSLSREWLEECAAVARTQAGLPAKRKGDA